MKANEPEKIYLEAIYPDNGVLPNGLNYTPSPTDIEYIRTDAFIKKAENFLEMLGCGFTITDNITHTNYGKEQLIQDFEEYLKK